MTLYNWKTGYNHNIIWWCNIMIWFSKCAFRLHVPPNFKKGTRGAFHSTSKGMRGDSKGTWAFHIHVCLHVDWQYYSLWYGKTWMQQFDTFTRRARQTNQFLIRRYTVLPEGSIIVVDLSTLLIPYLKENWRGVRVINSRSNAILYLHTR